MIFSKLFYAIVKDFCNDFFKDFCNFQAMYFLGQIHQFIDPFNFLRNDKKGIVLFDIYSFLEYSLYSLVAGVEPESEE